ncbi:uroporphyrinogen decarboxylase family protein [Maribellus sediminis]|uniref:uroporphyrinogen decarboxylase family protein n=1 Tax=Maribellus sediminis TaxID=2696285 RepID=UPI001431ED17|nr:uroporphyrinogen decarboxylase family protein [Maribellus sediminis]
MKKFNTQLADSQATVVKPISPENFNFGDYAEYASNLNRRCSAFWQSDSGVVVYRRMRVAACFSYGCSDMQQSLEWQLGALEKSMLFNADVPNFLEPWYGLGTIASAFGCEYSWKQGNAPVVKPPFKNLDEVLDYPVKKVAETAIGKHTLNMIEYFMDKTKGQVPVSFTDSQSPLNSVANLLPLDQFFVEVLLNPDKVLSLFDLLADLSVEFNNEQQKLIGDALALPGHGFASSQKWSGMGMSDDNAIMISPEQYTELAVPSAIKVCDPFGGVAFHSCGDWSGWIDAVLNIEGIKMADGAFSLETDPGATNNLEAFHAFAGTGVVLNARIVGDTETIEQQVKRVWMPGMKLVVVTYCETPEEQTKAYNRIKEICR